MKATDLMVGDWITCKFDDKNCVVDSIIKQNDGSMLIASDNDLHFDYMYNPILITVDILKNNGFSQDSYDKSHWYLQTAIVDENMVRRTCINVFLDENIFFDILDEESGFTSIFRSYKKYVHELQHALRLCGIKKEIVL